MKIPPALMTEAERARYRLFLAAAEEKLACDRHHLAKLRARLRLSGAIAHGSEPNNVATMYSQVRIRDMKSGRTHIQTVVLPTEAEALTRPLSSWPGPMLLGAREGDEIQWCSGEVLQHLRLEEVIYQPSTARSISPAHRPQEVLDDAADLADIAHPSAQRHAGSRGRQGSRGEQPGLPISR
jgi:transcription elongation GreA/GreB family factor